MPASFSSHGYFPSSSVHACCEERRSFSMALTVSFQVRKRKQPKHTTSPPLSSAASTLSPTSTSLGMMSKRSRPAAPCSLPSMLGGRQRGSPTALRRLNNRALQRPVYAKNKATARTGRWCCASFHRSSRRLRRPTSRRPLRREPHPSLRHSTAWWAWIAIMGLMLRRKWGVPIHRMRRVLRPA